MNNDVIISKDQNKITIKTVNGECSITNVNPDVNQNNIVSVSPYISSDITAITAENINGMFDINKLGVIKRNNAVSIIDDFSDTIQYPTYNAIYTTTTIVPDKNIKSDPFKDLFGYNYDKNLILLLF